jgi:hypothetical protein
MTFGLPKLHDLGGQSMDATNPYTHINCVANAAGFFNNVRTPAALLVIPALNSLWLDISSTTSRRKHPVAQTCYTMLVLSALLLQLTAVFVSTVAGTRLMAGGFDPMGPDAVSLLVREFELPYLTTHLAFVSGLVSFMSSIGLRAWIQFGDTLHPKIGRALTVLTITFIANMVAYFHASITHFRHGIPGLIMRFLVLYLHEFGLAGLLSVASVAWVTFVCQKVVRDQVNEHGRPTGGLSVQQLPQRSPVLPPASSVAAADGKQQAESWRNWNPASWKSEKVGHSR